MISLKRRFGKDLKAVDRRRVLVKRMLLFLLRKRKNSKKDLRKVRCFDCSQYDHFASQCPKTKKKKEEEDTIVSASRLLGFMHVKYFLLNDNKV